MKIWKFELPSNDCALRMPQDARVLRVAAQQAELYVGIFLWALVDPDQPIEERRFVCVNTGDEAPEGDYLASLEVGDVVWHAFEVGR